MNFITETLAQLVAKIPPDIVLLIIAGIILYIFFIKGLPQLRRLKAFGRRLEAETKQIRSSEKLDLEELGKSLPEIEPLLVEFRELVNNDQKNKQNNTQNCEVIISDESVCKALDVDEAFLEHYPGIFSALGISGTFIGILFVLVPLSGQVEESVHKLSIDRLLQGAGTAFLTSILGIGMSIAFLYNERRTLGKFRKQLFDFQMAINNRLDRVTSESVLIDIKGELQEVKDALETMADDIGTAVSSSISQTLESVSKVLESSIDKAGSSSYTIVEQVMSSIDGTLNKFSENLEKMEKSSTIQTDILERFDKSVNNTTELMTRLEKILPAMTKAAEDFELSSQRLEKLPDALLSIVELQEEFTSVVKDSINLMSNSWIEEKERLTNLIEELREQYTSFENGIVNGLQITMSKFDDELSRAGTYVATWLDRLNDDVGKFTNQIGNFNTLLQDGASNTQVVLNDFSNVFTNHFAGFQSELSNVLTRFTNSHKEIESELNKLPVEIKNTVQGIENIHLNNTEELSKLFSEHIFKIAEEIEKTTKKGLFKRVFTRN
ncbi:anti-phage defense ZorAB system ZorA [bacterium]|nr:anti-phage defense ZorAB system ZorA [bacterium]